MLLLVVVAVVVVPVLVLHTLIVVQEEVLVDIEPAPHQSLDHKQYLYKLVREA